MNREKDVDYLKRELEPRGVKLRQLPSLLFGDFLRSFLDQTTRAADGPLSRDPEQNQRSIKYGNRGVAVIIGATIAGLVSYQSTQDAYRETRACSIQHLTEAGFSESNPPTVAEAEIAVADCVPVDVRNSGTVAREAQIALDQMGIEVIFTNN